MKQSGRSIFASLLRDERGSLLPFMALVTILFVGMGGLTLDLGKCYVEYRELQASTDAAAFAAAYAMTQSTASSASVKNAASSYSSVATGLNANPNLQNVTISTTLECLTSVKNAGIPCTASTTGDNAVQVVQTATVPTLFLRVLSMLGASPAQSLTLKSISTAGLGGSNLQLNLAILLDTTNSMSQNDNDASCGSTRISCALQGVQTLLQSLSPCTADTVNSNPCTPFDRVSLFTFPNVQANTVSNETTCPSSNPTILPYSTPAAGAGWMAPTGTAATYQITGYVNNYSSTNQAGGALSTTSALGIASGAKKNCSGLQTPGGDGTYFAGAIYAALSSLAAVKTANSVNALIILSDGDASAKASKMSGTLNSNGTYPSAIDQCQQAITAAKSAPSGTTVYTIAYGASSSGCSTDTSGPLAGISPCQTMQDMATNSADFYSDATASQNNGQCVSANNPNLTLNQIFEHVGTNFSFPRLIPDNSQ